MERFKMIVMLGDKKVAAHLVAETGKGEMATIISGKERVWKGYVMSKNGEARQIITISEYPENHFHEFERDKVLTTSLEEFSSVIKEQRNAVDIDDLKKDLKAYFAHNEEGRSLVVEGKLPVPGEGFELELIKAIPQGIIPSQLIVYVNLRPPAGEWDRVLLRQSVKYEQKEAIDHIESVMLRCNQQNRYIIELPVAQ